MLRITEAHDESSDLMTLRLEGRLIGRWVEVTRGASLEARNRCRSVVIDLAGVVFIDSDGVNLVRELIEHGVKVVKCSPFISEILREVTEC